MLVIGLTGGIGSGKTTVTDQFLALGVPVIDADQIARELTQPDSPQSLQILSHFGPVVARADGSLDRAKLRHLIFNDAEKKQWLEKCLHPPIAQEIKKRLGEVKAAYCIVSIPLLIETGPYAYLNRILAVEAPLELRLQRLTSRDNSQREDLLKIIKAQVDSDERLKVAQDIIHNDGSLSELKKKVLALHQHYLKLSQ